MHSKHIPGKPCTRSLLLLFIILSLLMIFDMLRNIVTNYDTKILIKFMGMKECDPVITSMVNLFRCLL